PRRSSDLSARSADNTIAPNTASRIHCAGIIGPPFWRRELVNVLRPPRLTPPALVAAIVSVQSARTIDPDTAVWTDRIGGARRQRDEDVVEDGIRGHRMRVRRRRVVVEPGFVRIDDAEDRSARIVARGQIVVIVARIEPDLVAAADLMERGDHMAGAQADDLRLVRKRHAGRGRALAAEQRLL